MTCEEAFDLWTPSASPWSAWAKPALFANAPAAHPEGPGRVEPEAEPLAWTDPKGGEALVVDLRGTRSLTLGLEVARSGYQPVPLFNCATSTEAEEVLPTAALRAQLMLGAEALKSIAIPAGAPPAFLLDADRIEGKSVPSAGKFDNRWMTFPEDFPSATTLQKAGIVRITLVQAGATEPQEDLRHVLVKWQDAGLPITALDLDHPDRRLPLRVSARPTYRWFFQRTMILLGLRRNSAAGFGSLVPEPSASSG